MLPGSSRGVTELAMRPRPNNAHGQLRSNAEEEHAENLRRMCSGKAVAIRTPASTPASEAIPRTSAGLTRRLP